MNPSSHVTLSGKGAVDETLPNYGGVYAGDGSNEGVREIVESSDLVLSIGAIKSDFNTAGFTYHTSTLTTIDFHSHVVKVKYSEYNGVRMHGVLRKIAAKMPKFSPAKLPIPAAEPSDKSDSSDVITHKWFWPHLTNWVKEKDIIVTETGTSGYGIWEVRFKKNTSAISQILWGSIGFAHGATQGAALAAKELTGHRTILFTGAYRASLERSVLMTKWLMRSTSHNRRWIVSIDCAGAEHHDSPQSQPYYLRRLQRGT